jgi:phosphate-selective porin OprO/OprP
MHLKRTLSVFLTAVSLTIGLAQGQTQTNQTSSVVAAYEQEIQELRRRLDDLEQKLTSVQVAQRKEEIKADAVAANPPGELTANADGFILKSADGNFTARVGGYVQLDGRSYYADNSPGLAADTLLIRKLRPEFKGTVFKYVDYRFLPDFGNASVAIFDAYLELKYFPKAALRVGKFKAPVGLERLQQDVDDWFTELAPPAGILPNRDVGYQLSGDVVKDRIAYQVGAFNGGVDNNTPDLDTNNGKDFDARVFLTPWKPSRTSVLSGLGFGISGTLGNQTGGVLPTYKTIGQDTFFTYASTAVAYGTRKRFSPQADYFLGSFGVMAEYAKNEQGIRKTATSPIVTLTNSAWQVEAAYLLTGEKKTYGTVNPKKVFDPSRHTWGAIELVGRTGGLSVDHNVFAAGLADPTKSARYEREWAAGVNWYLNRATKIQVDFGHTNFSAGAVGGNRPTEKFILTRFQLYI